MGSKSIFTFSKSDDTPRIDSYFSSDSAFSQSESIKRALNSSANSSDSITSESGKEPPAKMPVTHNFQSSFRFDDDKASDNPSELADLKSLIVSLHSKFDQHLSEINPQLQDINKRLSALEEHSNTNISSVTQLRERVVQIEQSESNLEQRVRELESVGSEGREDREEWKWSPTGSDRVSVKLLGDSNSSGKIKFGDGKGTLGPALPGSSVHCPTLSNLTNPDSQEFENVSDVVIAVGTNNLRQQGSKPEELVENTFTYVAALLKKRPEIHVLLPGVLPICTPGSETNSKVKLYNHFIKTMCNSHIRLTYIDTKVFMANDGSLKTGLAMGTEDPLHLNTSGLKLYFSRIKYALRARHDLPNSRRVKSNKSPRPRYRAGGEEQMDAEQGSQNDRGGNSNHRGRGGGTRRGRYSDRGRG